MGKFLIFLIGVPLLETWFLIRMGGVIGALPTIALVILTAVIGGNLVRYQGVSTMQRMQQQMASGQMPAAEMFAGVFILIAGVLLITPGFFTDALGFLFLFPPFRHWAAEKLISSGIVAMANNQAGGMGSAGQGSSGFGEFHYRSQQPPHGRRSRSQDGDIIDAEYEVVDDVSEPKSLDQKDIK